MTYLNSNIGSFNRHYQKLAELIQAQYPDNTESEIYCELLWLKNYFDLVVSNNVELEEKPLPSECIAVSEIDEY